MIRKKFKDIVNYNCSTELSYIMGGAYIYEMDNIRFMCDELISTSRISSVFTNGKFEAMARQVKSKRNYKK
jgi:hypothetical protein